MSLNQRSLLQSHLISGATVLQIPLSEEICERMLCYLELLEVWNKKFNLTAVRDPVEMVTRHLLDSLSIATFVQGKTLVDIGSGAGLPGIPLALMSPERHITLIDSNGKKVRFLQEAKSALGLANLNIVLSRIEQVRQGFDCVTARAFSTLGDMLKLGGHLLASGGVWLAQKGRYPDAELAGVPSKFRIVGVPRLVVPGLQAERHVVILQHKNFL